MLQNLDALGLRPAVASDDLTIQRRRRGKGFEFIDASGARIVRRATLDRLRGLGIPPAYVDVRIAASAQSHIQAVGRDAAGRLQYVYHPKW